MGDLRDMNTRTLQFGIVQGRLVQSPPGCLQWFPQEDWESEYFLAAALGYDYIENIAEREHNKHNPLWSDEGTERIKALSARNGLSQHAFCNDYIIDHSLIRDKGAMKQTLKLIARGKLLGMQKLILPLFEESELTESNAPNYTSIVKEIASAAQENGTLVCCLETILEGPSLLRWLETLGQPNVKCVLDTGNKIALGHDIYADILLLREYIQHVHIKDKDKEGNNVLLGTGMVDFRRVFQSLAEIDFRGPYTFEVTRGRNPVRTAKYNLEFVKFFVEETTKNGN
jgi:sugar phosphate isomerase/epimerase